ncbi:uncharacterized protein ColSpa_04400 [Colletotrichum spaethianum]|uniref:Uncharacterized protein n=1 Tax=Colletotrichum spaethianum TaxID=700344 RepID=A0AA37LCV9_9PEZI|nr:uncharacterized protein ColSpa_04400 [Colletotrichum spaethianum]GKT44219.1 hypothetical protein ColSpa_04400 [Colletotrichum spaethianum]
MSAAANFSCPTSSVPENLQIPQDVTYAVIPGHNISDSWMASCCQPNPVQLVQDCWEWCEIPAAITNGTTSETIPAAFSQCLQANGRDLNASNGLIVHVSSAATPSRHVSFTNMAMAALVASTVSSVFLTAV